jgi:hypothetical protein
VASGEDYMQAVRAGIQQRAQSLLECAVAPVGEYLRLIDQREALWYEFYDFLNHL